jgi:hypothetical protein
MSVRDISKPLVSRVAEKLTPLGFGCSGAVFSRPRGAYIERYHIAGSQWNSGSFPWQFSIEVGVFFPDVPPLANVKGFWRKAHAVGSSGGILRGTWQGFDVEPRTLDAAVRQVVENILVVSDVLPSLRGQAYTRAKNGYPSLLPESSSGASDELR